MPPRPTRPTRPWLCDASFSSFLLTSTRISSRPTNALSLWKGTVDKDFGLLWPCAVLGRCQLRAYKRPPSKLDFVMHEVGIRYGVTMNRVLRTGSYAQGITHRVLRTEPRCNHFRCILLKLSKLISYTRVTLIAPSIKLDNR